MFLKNIFKKVLLSFVLIGCIVALVGCNKQSDSNSIVGSWAHDSYVYTFNDNNTGNYEAGGTKMEFTYKDDGKKVSILYTGNTDASDYEYKIEGKKLIIKDSLGNDVEYIKK